MEVTVDKYGRILLPKLIRKSLGLKSGTRLEVTFDEKRKQLIISPTIFPIKQEIVYTDWGFPIIQRGKKGNKSFGNTKKFTENTYERYFNQKLEIE